LPCSGGRSVANGTKGIGQRKKQMNDEVVASKRRRKMKPRKRWKAYHRPGNGELLTREELARALGETPRTILRWRQKGLIPCLKLGHRSIRFRLDSVLAALDKRQVKGRRFFYQQPI
jgi:excisionase family DNA binding protein